jgi:DNA-directed RNA polymerase II subunit RPB1
MKRIKDTKIRMAKVHDHCKGKMICDPTEIDPDAEDAVLKERPELRTGCGHAQPVIRKEGLKMFMVYKKAKDEDEQVNPSTSMGRLFAYSK